MKKNLKSNFARLLLIEGTGAFTRKIQDALLARSNLKLFDLYTVAQLSEAFRDMDNAPVDLILIEVDPSEAPDFPSLTRLHHYAPEKPVIALLDDAHQALALGLIHKGAQDCLMEGQINPDTFPAYLLRAVERHAAQEAVRESEARFRLMIEHSSDVITTVDPDGLITYAGPSTERILDYPESYLVGKNILDFVHRDDRRLFLDKFETAFNKGGSLHPLQYRIRHNSGHYVHMEAKGRVVEDASGHSVCIMNSHDVSHRVALEEKLTALSLRDELTSLHNRRSFVTCVDQELKQAKRSHRKDVCLLFIDLDNFKWINDHLGHKEGDRVLVKAAEILKTTFREADLVARLGGDEFVVFLTDEKGATNVDMLKDRLQENIQAWNNQESRRYTLSMSVGVVRHDLSIPRSVEELLAEADALMYHHKRAKKAAQASAAGASVPAPSSHN